MSAGKAVAAAYLVLALALIIFEYSEFIHPPGDGRWVGMISMMVTLPTSIVVNFVARQIGAPSPGESPVAFLAIMGVAALLNAAGLAAMINASLGPDRK